MAHFLGLSVNDLIKVYVPELAPKQIGEIQRAREAGYIVENFDVSILVKMKFFNSNASSKDMSDKIKRFFNIFTVTRKILCFPFLVALKETRMI